MKLSHGMGLLAATVGSLALVIPGLLATTACSSSSSGGSSSSSGGGGNQGAPPSLPSGAPATTITKSHNYALHKLYLGDTNRQGVTDMNAWKAIGYNLDGKVTTSASTDVCTLYQGASKTVQTDGNNGIDNSFGSTLVPIITTVAPTASMTLNTSIQDGSFTLFTYVTGFDDAANSTTTAKGLSGVLLAGAKFSQDGGAPDWTTSTNWPALPDPGLISGCTPYSASGGGGCPAGTDPVKNAVIKFPNAFQANGTFVNGSPSPLSLSLSIGGQMLTLNIASAVITFQSAGGGSVTNGTIAGVLNTMDLVNSLRNVAGSISSSLCSGSAFNDIATQIYQASDIQLNGTTVENNAGSACDAISVGLGFDATEIAAPTDIAAASPPAPSKCMDAGTD